MNDRLAFLGMGVMGSAMAKNLWSADCNIKVWNRSPESPYIQALQEETAIKISSSIAEAVTDADIIFVCVSDVLDVEEVLLAKQGVINYAKSGSLIVDFSTIGSQAVKDISQQLADQNIHFLDAPVSGGDVGAKQGTLTIMVGGEKADFDRCLPYLKIMGKNITHCGEIGSGQAVKMCNQVLCSLHMVALCEAMELAKKQGIDPHLVIQVCSTGAAGSWALSNLGEKIIDADYQPGFMIKHILKDLRLVQETLKENDRFLGVELAQKLFQIAAESDQGEGYSQGTQAMIKSYLREQ